MKFNYGRNRDFHDVRDRLLRRAVPPSWPIRADMQAWEQAPFDQGDYGSCTANAGAGVARMCYLKYFGIQYTPSRAYLYDKERLLEGTFPDDSGAQMRTICQTLNKFGFALEGDWPYTADSLQTPPTPATDVIANTHHDLLGYHRLADVESVISCLGDPTPWPVLIGFTVYQSFESQQVASTGIMPVPGPNEMVMGGHAVYAKGYDLDKQAVLCRNSWGADWGLNGDFWMPMAILSRPDTDLWVIHLGPPWK